MAVYKKFSTYGMTSYVKFDGNKMSFVDVYKNGDIKIKENSFVAQTIIEKNMAILADSTEEEYNKNRKLF